MKYTLMESDSFNQYMKKAEEKLKSSEYLFKGGFYEDAISRAYYSMYYAARALLSLKKIHPKTHKGVIRELGLEMIKKGFLDEVYGKTISHAKDRREQADYGLDIKTTKEDARQLLEETREFIQKIEEARKGLNR